MNAIVKNFRKLATFAKTLGRDTRGDDAANTTYNVSKAGFVIVAASGVVGAGYLAAQSSNNTAAISDKTQKDIAGVNGANVGSTQAVSAPFAK